MNPDRTLTDEQLIEQYLTRPADEAGPAFAALVTRHGPMVMEVCRHLLNQLQDVEDAFQATFLTLVRRAGEIRDRQAVGGWLRQVATRNALGARARNARLRSLPVPARDEVSPGSAERDASRNELRLILLGELDRLPKKYRLPLVHCHLEGKTNGEVARLLGCPIGTVKGRLSRARAILRERLSNRGLDADHLGRPWD
jgi:RNA polymerase sigma factor (sigma-70 family)